MPDEDPADVFLRHRGAVLDALLSDPSFGTSDDSAGARSAPGSGGNFDIDAALLDLPPVGPDPTTSAPAPSRPAGGQRASDRINALLNGHPSGGPAADYSNEYAEMASSRLNATARDTEAAQHAESAAPDRPSSPTGAKRPPGEAMVRDALTQLRKPKVAMAVGGVLAVVLVLILILTGGEKQPQDQVLVLPPPTATEPAPTSAPADSGAGPIEPRSAESHCPPGGTDGMDAFSGEPGKAWSCARAYKVDGQILRIDLGKTYEIQSIGIVPGWDHVGTDGTDQWSKYRTVSRVSYQFDDNDATVLTQDTLDQRTLVVTTLDPPVRASQIVLTVLESTGDATVNTTAISSIVITGR